MSEEEALDDLRARVKNYEDVYEPLDDDTQSYIKVDVGGVPNFLVGQSRYISPS